jgi:hypothetical protein
MRLLDRKPLLDLSIPANMQKISELQPDAERPVTPIAAANLPPAPTLSRDDIVAALRSIDSWTASGLDLLSTRILKSVLDEVPGVFHGETGSKVLCAVAQRFIGGNIPASVTPLFASAQVLATRKSNSGARPIAIGTTTRRAILKGLIRKVTPVAAEYLAPHQLAVGVKTGWDVVAHGVRAAIEKYSQDDGRALLRIYAENAFNKVSHAAILDVALTHVPGMARMAYAVYGQPPLLKAGDRLFDSREGARQGCQLSMMTCCVAEHPTVEKIEAKRNLDVNLWIADDGSLYGKIDQLLAIDIILEAEETTGYRMNKTKSSLWNFADEHSAACASRLPASRGHQRYACSRHCSSWIIYWLLRIRL